MQYLKADTITEVTIGPAVAVGDGFTPVTTLVGTTADEFEIIKHGATTTTTIAGTLAAITGADGYYALDLSATDTNTEGRLTLLINDDSLILPIRHEFMVVAANVFDSLFAVAGTDLLQTDMREIVGGVVPTPTTTGVPDVNVERWLDTLVTLGAGAPDVNVQSMDAASIAAGVIAAAELTNIENEIWDALKSAHVVANSFGDFLDIEVSGRAIAGDAMALTAAAVDAIWDEAVAGHVGAGSVGNLVERLDLILAGGAGELTAARAANLDNADALVSSRATPAQVNTEVVDVINTDTSGEPAQGAPAAAASLRTKIDWLYKTFRNKKTQTATLWALFNDAGTVIDSKATVSDDATTATKEEVVAGP